MIQRFQSLYLFLYIINKCYLLYKYSIDKNLFHFFIDKPDLIFILLILLLIILSIITLFSFKNRKNQIKLLYYLIIIQVFILASMLILSYIVENPLNSFKNNHTYHHLLGLLLLLLSLRGIKKDQRLIDSINRIR